MADFCLQCSQDMGFDEPDLAGITSQSEWESGLARQVLCEGCGVTLVDPDGKCITNCLLHHNTSPDAWKTGAE